MTYKEQLLDPRWQKKRLEILTRDKFTCKHCYDDTKTLMVHHTFYEKGKMAWEANDEHLITLCGDCHLECHEKIPQYHRVLVDQLKIKLTDTWINGCVAELFTNVSDLHGLIYILWEAERYIGEEKLLAVLRDFIFPDSYTISESNEIQVING